MILAYLKRLFLSDFVLFSLFLTGVTVLFLSILWLIDKIPNIEKILRAIFSVWALLGLLAIGLIIGVIFLVCDFLEFRRNYKEAKKAGAAHE